MKPRISIYFLFSFLFILGCKESVKPVYHQNPETVTSDYAIVSLFGAKSSVGIAKVDGKYLKSPIKADSPYLYLIPGPHEFTLVYVHDTAKDRYSIGKFTGANAVLKETLKPGHVYFADYELVGAEEKRSVNFWLRDMGPDYPRECLPRVFKYRVDEDKKAEKLSRDECAEMHSTLQILNYWLDYGKSD